MTSHRPTPHEHHLIERLEARGYAVLRRGTLDNLRKRLAVAQREVEWEQQSAEHARQWARRESDEARRLAARLTDVAAAAAAQGVSIEAINAALHPPGS